MSSSVKIRGSKHGISVKLDPSASYEDIKNDVASEFRDAGKFLGEEKLAVCFEGQYLTEQQQEELTQKPVTLAIHEVADGKLSATLKEEYQK